MRKQTIIGSLAIVGVCLSVGSAKMSSGTTLEPRALSIESTDTILLDTIVAKIETEQEKYLKVNGTYWQGLSTQDIPSIGQSKLHRKPTDVSKDWSDMGLGVPLTSRFSFRTDVYDGPNGKGYTLTIQTPQDGVVYEKVISVGQEQRGHNWTRL